MDQKQQTQTKQYRIRILTQCGSTQQWETETLDNVSYFGYDKRFYMFVANDKKAYYPMDNTIVEEL